MDTLWLLLGLIALLGGGEMLVRGASSLALHMRITPLVVGMTVVSIGTSAPELIVSLKAAMSGHPDIAVGNVVGSNMANILLVLGLTALVFPVAVGRNSLRIDWPVMMLASATLWAVMTDLSIERWEGAIFVMLLAIFVYFLIQHSRKHHNTKAVVSHSMNLWASIALVLVGGLVLVLGAGRLVVGASGIARDLGVSERIISISVIAFGTSLPELITSLVAAFRKQPEISLGNLIGSNIFNIWCILGATAVVHPVSINQRILDFDIYWVVGSASLLLPLMLMGRKLARWQGAVLFAGYLAYLYFGILA